MKTETIVMCVVALILGMLMANMLKSVCGCKSVVEGLGCAVGGCARGPNGENMVIDTTNNLGNCLTYGELRTKRNTMAAQIAAVRDDGAAGGKSQADIEQAAEHIRLANQH